MTLAVSGNRVGGSWPKGAPVRVGPASSFIEAVSMKAMKLIWRIGSQIGVDYPGSAGGVRR